METVEVGGLRIAYRRAGSGPVLVPIHGALGDSRDWRRQLEGLSDELTVVAWDAPGCGASDDRPGAVPAAPRVAGMRAMTRSFADADLRDVLPGIRVPTLLLYGDADRRSPLGTVAAELHRMIPGGTLVLLHSPLVGVASWGTLPETLGRAGAGAVAVPVGGDDRPPSGRP